MCNHVQMGTLEQLQVRVISLTNDTRLLPGLRTVFKDVEISEGVDFRHLSAQQLLEAGYIGELGYDNILMNSKRSHRDFKKSASVGVAQAYLKAIATDVSVPLLLIEEDAVLQYERLRTEVDGLLQHGDLFDIAVFGCTILEGPEASMSSGVLPPRWRVPSSSTRFLLTHCVLYLPSGRKHALQILHRPLDMHFDYLLSIEASIGRVRCVITEDGAFAHQKMNLDEKHSCWLCFLPHKFPLQWFLVAFAIAAVVVWRVKMAEYGRCEKRIQQLKCV